MKCSGFKGSDCDREIMGEIVDTKTDTIIDRYCWLHRPAFKDARVKRYIDRYVKPREISSEKWDALIIAQQNLLVAILHQKGAHRVYDGEEQVKALEALEAAGLIEVKWDIYPNRDVQGIVAWPSSKET